MNLYLYLPPTSAQPLSVICGMIYGMLRNYDEQNSHQRHCIETTVLLFWRLATRGWDTTLLQLIFNDVTEKVETTCPSRTQERKVNTDNGRNRIFIHMEYHPNGIPRKEIRFRPLSGFTFLSCVREGHFVSTFAVTLLKMCCRSVVSHPRVASLQNNSTVVSM